MYNNYMRMLYIRVGARMCIVHIIIIDYITCASTAAQIHNDERQDALEDSGYFSKVSDKSIGDIAISTH